jgi:hypothetical protein
MDVQQKDLSYFRLRLQELLNSSFPEKAHDQKFITNGLRGLPMLMRVLSVRETPLSNATK